MDSQSTPPILILGDPRLQHVAAALTEIDAEAHAAINALGASLLAFRHESGFGRGIAAPQLGILRRIVVLDLGAGPIALINPLITWRSAERFEVWDDCFSVPDRLVRVRRHCSISVSYRDAQFRRREWQRLPPDLAELLQHEIDHLDGVLMTDHALGDDAVRPIADRGRCVVARRRTHRLSLARIADAAQSIDPVFLHSPQFVSDSLSGVLGCRVLLKVETLNPIRCFKGRGAEFFMLQRMARGERTALVCASAGNFGQALAYACRKHGVALQVFAARNANPLKLQRMRALGAQVRLDGEDFDAAKAAARRHAERHDVEMVEDGLNAAISEGAGTIGVELLSGDPVIDAVYLPLGNGALLSGVARWIKARSPVTRVIGVVSRGAPAMALSWRRGPDAPVAASTRIDTIADGIAVRIPIAEAIADMHGLVDDVVEVDDTTLIEAMRLAHQHAGIVVEPAGAAGLAAMLDARATLAGQTVATVLCGGNLTNEQIQQWLLRTLP
ncbi:MAG: pyridoxal-phosphate dependent enzyme [Tahibacter sp.]